MHSLSCISLPRYRARLHGGCANLGLELGLLTGLVRPDVAVWESLDVGELDKL